MNSGQKGSALLNAIIVAGIVAGIAGILLSQTRDTDKMSRPPRIKSAMTVLETQMLSMALQPGIYQSCSAQSKNCQLNSNAVATFQHLAHNIVGAHCSGGTYQPGSGGISHSSQQQCGVKVQAASSLACLNSKNSGYNSNCTAGQFYNPATQTFCAEIVYEGTELAMQPVCASTTVPQSVLQGDSTACNSPANLTGPYPKVIFRGYDSAGNAVCAAIPSCSGGNVQLSGNYISAIDKISMQTQCKALSQLLSCPPGTVMANLKWNNVNSAFGSVSPAMNCVPRQTPPDNHQIQAATPITVPPGIYKVGSPLGGPPPGPPVVPPVAGNATIRFGGCFIAGTQVMMEDGSTKSIELVQVGDKILTYDESRDRQVIRPVSEIDHHDKHENDLYTFTLSDGSHVTSNDIHLFFLVDYRQYASAAEIYRHWSHGAELRLLNDKNQPVVIADMKKETKDVKVYNLHVQSEYDLPNQPASHYGHNYYANGVLVHNCKALCPVNVAAAMSNKAAACCSSNGGTYTSSFLGCAVMYNCTLPNANIPAARSCVAAWISGPPVASPCPNGNYVY